MKDVTIRSDGIHIRFEEQEKQNVYEITLHETPQDVIDLLEAAGLKINTIGQNTAEEFDVVRLTAMVAIYGPKRETEFQKYLRQKEVKIETEPSKPT